MKKGNKWRDWDLTKECHFGTNFITQIKKNTIECRWVLMVKLKEDSDIDRCKTRLATKGYTQRCGEYFQETFSLVAKINKIHILISIVANWDWPLQ